MKQKVFNKIYDAYSRKLYNYALWLTRNKDASDDIIQAAFIKFWKYDKNFNHEGEQEAWLYKVTRNLCIDFFRKSTRFTKFRLKYSQENPNYITESHEMNSVWEMLDLLNETDKSILYLFFRIGHSHKMVAKILQLNENSVRVKAFRALEKLRKKCVKEIL